MQPKIPPTRGPLPSHSYQPPSAPPIPVHGTGGNIPNLARPGGNPPANDRGLQSSTQYLRTPIVRYSSVMRVGKQHPMRISLMGANGETEPEKTQSLSGGFDPPILVLVTIPGALVTPNSQIIPLSGGDANFIVQPISSGKLKGAKVEFLSQGRKISEIPLPIKANRGSLGKWLITLGVLLPILINLLPELTFKQQTLEATNTPLPPRLGPDGLPLRESGVSFSGGGGGGKAPAKSPDGTRQKVPAKNSKEKSEGNNPEKSTEKTPVKPAASLKPVEQDAESVVATLITLQLPKSNDAKPPSKDVLQTPSKGETVAPSKSESTPKSNVDETNGKEKHTQSQQNEKPVPAATQKPGSDAFGGYIPTDHFITYRGEDAIWAWVRHKLYQNGYKTKSISSKDHEDQVSQFLTVNRTYEITSESTRELSTSRIAAMGLYYLEPVLRLLYRVFIQFPRDVPFADLGYGLFFIALGVIAWVMTGPNRKKVKGSVMDIR